MPEFIERLECPTCSRPVGERHALTCVRSPRLVSPSQTDIATVRYYREGRVPVTDEMVERAADAYHSCAGEKCWSMEAVRAALDAALNGGEDE